MKLAHLLVFAALFHGGLCQYGYEYFTWLSHIMGYSRSVRNEPAAAPPERPVSTSCPAECTCPPIFPTAMYCDTRRLKHIPAVPARMRYVYLQNNQIEDVPEGAFDNATGLIWVVLHRNRISNEKIGKGVFAKLKSLKRLYLDHNGLTEISFPLPGSLRQLRLASNKISEIQPDLLRGLKNLTMLLLNDNQLQDVGGSLEGLTSLRLLDLSNNQLEQLPDGLPESLHQIYLDFNRISSVPEEYFRKLPKLQYARISNNRLTDGGIPRNTFNVSNLIELDLSHNKLRTIPPVSTNLENLYLHANRITEFALDSFCKHTGIVNFSRIQVLRLDGNAIKPEELPHNTHQCLRHARIIDI